MIRHGRSFVDGERTELDAGGGGKVRAPRHVHRDGVGVRVGGLGIAAVVLHRDGAHVGILTFHLRSGDTLLRAAVSDGGRLGEIKMLRRGGGLIDGERFVPREADGIVVACRETTLFEVIRADVVAGGAAKRSRQ